MAKLTDKILKVIDGTAYMASGEGLGAYHAANRVKAALRRKDPNDRLSGVREALNAYRVTAWISRDGDRISLRRDGVDVLTL